MSYYTELQRMHNSIEKLLQQVGDGLARAELIYNLQKRYAVSEKAIMTRLNLLQEMGKVELDNTLGRYKWQE